MLEQFTYTLKNAPKNVFLEKGRRKFFPYHVWTPGSFKVHIEQGTIPAYQGVQVLPRQTPFTLNVLADYNIGSEDDDPSANEAALQVGFLVDLSSKTLTLQGNELLSVVKGSSRRYFLKYAADMERDGVANLSEFNDDTVSLDMVSTREIGTNPVSNWEVWYLGLHNKGFPRQVSWLQTIQRFLPVRGHGGILTVPNLTYSDVRRAVLAGASTTDELANRRNNLAKDQIFRSLSV